MRLILIILGLFYSLTSLSAQVDPPFDLSHALDVIESTYGDKVRIKPKTLFKFGHSEQVQSGTYTTLMDLPTGTYNETYVSSNIIDTVSSSNAGDTQTINIEGHTIDSNGDFTFVVQSATLDGQNKVTLTKPLARVTRFYNTNSTSFAGDIYIYEDDTVTAGVPNTSTKVHILVHADDESNQSMKMSTTLSKDDYWLVTEAHASVNQKSGSPIAEVRLEIRNKGGVFRVVALSTVSTAGGAAVTARFSPPVIVPKNSDFRMRALASANNIFISGWVNGYLAKKID